jgi:hypothetical protein
MRASGIGLSDAARLGLSVVWRWALCSERGDEAIQALPATLARREGAWRILGKGYWLVAGAERLPA